MPDKSTISLVEHFSQGRQNREDIDIQDSLTGNMYWTDPNYFLNHIDPDIVEKSYILYS